MAKGKNIAVPSRGGGYESVSVRPIDNGYIVSRSTDKGYSETYTAKKPKIEVPAAPAMKSAPAKPSTSNGMSAVKRASGRR